METKIVTVPQLAMIGATRAMAGAGLGLLLSDRFERGRRRAVGWALLGVGALSTIPLVASVVSRNRRAARLRDAATEQARSVAPGTA